MLSLLIRPLLHVLYHLQCTASAVEYQYIVNCYNDDDGDDVGDDDDDDVMIIIMSVGKTAAFL